jgi:2-(1,2-epoxy-1,2-dihydrophenyl)acetyl-CoA isomerase
MSEDSVLYTSGEGIARITLHRPDKLNSFDQTMHAQLRAAFDRAEADHAVRVIVLAASGRGFCAGQDLADDGIDPTRGPVDIGATLEKNYKPLITKMANSRLPIICVVQGIAAGAGVSLALACDIVIAAESAAFMMAFSKIALIPDAGSTYFLPRAIGSPMALALALTGDKLPAAQAAQWGMIWKCVPDAQLAEQVDALAKQLAAGAPLALQHIKSLFRSSGTRELTAALDAERDCQHALGLSADYAEGVAAFKGKRAARYEGR